MKILVIDDKAENREAAVSMLAEHEVTTVSSYNDAIDLIDQIVKDEDVLLALGRPTRGGICIDDEFRAKAKELKPKFDFDIVLIDLMMPASDRTLGCGCEHRRGEQMPYGFPLMIQVAEHADKVKHIAIVSDVNHHNHAMSAALDPILTRRSGASLTMNGVPCSFIHANLQLNGSKDWDNALKKIISPKQAFLD